MNCAGHEVATQVIFPACHIRATASGISRRLAELGLNPSGYRVGQRVLTLVVGVQVDKRGTAGRVAHAFHQLTEVGTGLGDQAIAGVAEIMKMEPAARQMTNNAESIFFMRSSLKWKDKDSEDGTFVSIREFTI